jgi:Rrf2 family transcriptional regulator, iron-sulfur cluster assembly transcription factor
MKISALEEYGIRCMLLLARSEPDEAVALPEFREKEGLSIPYAAKLLMILKRAGLVKASRGRKGGYALARTADKIFLKEIIESLGEPAFSSSHCKRHTGQLNTCVHQDDCQVRVIWKSFDSFINQLLRGITLADVAAGKLSILENVQVTMGSESGSSEDFDSKTTKGI